MFHQGAGPEQSINQILQATFQILTYEKVGIPSTSVSLVCHFLQQRQPDLLGVSVFGPNEIYTRLKGFKAKLLEKYPHGKLWVNRL